MVKNSGWFKHYGNASQGHTLSVLWADGDVEGIALFWLILELVCRYEDLDDRGKIRLKWSVLQRETNWKPSKCRRVLARISPVSKIETNEEPDGYVSFLIPNWLKFQENRGSKTKRKSFENGGKTIRRKDEKTRDVGEVDKKHSPTTPSSAERFEARFDQSWNKALGDMNLDGYLRSHIAELKNRFSSPEEFLEFFSDLSTSKKVVEMSQGDARRYIMSAIKNEIGVLK